MYPNSLEDVAANGSEELAWLCDSAGHLLLRVHAQPRLHLVILLLAAPAIRISILALHVVRVPSIRRSTAFSSSPG